ncbi:HlyD family secretion protein [Photobacterium kishitanii]|uniref:efflux RND transporter periplasmic adaptor subunit n=1 Tax=Photobacterium kishitanii TaxID=318456 RepID=UPI0005D3BBCB|nr:HlyD family secretion protein [Photobacterium kishitanii]KJG10769.1 hypothetical protein UB40_05320 [Photobacterium kishitanii]PSV08116.1 HlyD family secretion protein [Photobacterium kishitanii]PSV75502.1 HlyD family secretion protein [Photobacterium kishitanii]
MNLIRRIGFTVVLVLLAIAAIIWKYQQYLMNPWTRDAQVQAQVITIAPRVTGPIVALNISDNEKVTVGQSLFNIDSSTYKVALAQAKASLTQAKVSVSEASEQFNRSFAMNRVDPGAVSKLKIISLQNNLSSAEAEEQQAQAKVDQAQLNVNFTQVKAPVSGYITNLKVQLGTQVVANKPVVALIDNKTFWIQAFFKETDVQHIHPGSHAVVTLMGYPNSPINGTVTSIGFGINPENPTYNDNLLQNVNPTFEWIRLAQRLPVRIHLDTLPKNVVLRVGTSASVIIKQHESQQ